jgi:hypothetical protein
MHLSRTSSRRRFLEASTLTLGSQLPRVGETPLTEVDSRLKLKPGHWCREKDATLVVLKMAKGTSSISLLS